MRSVRTITAIDSHTEGMPTRVVTGGVGVVPGATMAEKREYFIKHLDDLRLFLMNEPRGPLVPEHVAQLEQDMKKAVESLG